MSGSGPRRRLVIGARAELAPPPAGGDGSTRAPMTARGRGRLPCGSHDDRPRATDRAPRRSPSPRSSPSSCSVIASEPRPGAHGRGPAVTLSLLGLIGGVAIVPCRGGRCPTRGGWPASRCSGRRASRSPRCSPTAPGYAGVYFVVVVAAARLPLRAGAGGQRADAGRRGRRPPRVVARRRRGAHQRAAVLGRAVVLRHAAAAPAARSAATAPRRSSRSSRSRAPSPARRRRRWPSAAGSRATCTTCSRTRCRRSRCSSRARGCWRATATPTPRSSPPSSARTTSRADGLGEARARDRRAARRRDARARSALRALAEGFGDRVRADGHAASRASSPPRRGSRSTAPPRRRSPTSSRHSAAERVELRLAYEPDGDAAGRRGLRARRARAGGARRPAAATG